MCHKKHDTIRSVWHDFSTVYVSLILYLHWKLSVSFWVEKKILMHTHTQTSKDVRSCKRTINVGRIGKGSVNVNKGVSRVKDNANTRTHTHMAWMLLLLMKMNDTKRHRNVTFFPLFFSFWLCTFCVLALVWLFYIIAPAKATIHNDTLSHLLNKCTLVLLMQFVFYVIFFSVHAFCCVCVCARI